MFAKEQTSVNCSSLSSTRREQIPHQKITYIYKAFLALIGPLGSGSRCKSRNQSVKMFTPECGNMYFYHVSFSPIFTNIIILHPLVRCLPGTQGVPGPKEFHCNGKMSFRQSDFGSRDQPQGSVATKLVQLLTFYYGMWIYAGKYFIRYATDLTLSCCIFRPAFGCCALQTLVEKVIFSIFSAKNFKKARNLQQISAKKQVFYICTRTLVDCFIPKK